MSLFSRFRSGIRRAVERVRSIFAKPPEVEPEVRPVEPVEVEQRQTRRQTKGQIRRQDRANTIYQKQINLASSGDESTVLGEMGKEKSKIFYKATQRLWEGHALHERNAIIMQKLGFNSLEKCMDYVLSKNTDAIDFARSVKGKEGYVQGGEESSNISSPEYLADVTPVIS